MDMQEGEEWEATVEMSSLDFNRTHGMPSGDY